MYGPQLAAAFAAALAKGSGDDERATRRRVGMLLWYLGLGVALLVGGVTGSAVVALAMIVAVTVGTLAYAERWPQITARRGKEK